MEMISTRIGERVYNSKTEFIADMKQCVNYDCALFWTVGLTIIAFFSTVGRINSVVLYVNMWCAPQRVYVFVDVRLVLCGVVSDAR